MCASQPSDESHARPASGDDVARDIEAELKDHLSSAADELRRGGRDEQTAQEEANRRFGDRGTIGRRLWWINRGEEVMFRIVATVALAIVCVGVGALAVGGWQLQTSFESRMDTLAQRLEDLTKMQQALLEQDRGTSPAARSITGTAYIGSPNIPATGAEIALVDIRTDKTLRRMIVDDDGRFRSGALGDGEYVLRSRLMYGSVQRRSGWMYESAPFYHYDGAEVVESTEIDLGMTSGVRFEIADQLPDELTLDNRDYAVRLTCVIGDRTPSHRLSDEHFVPGPDTGDTVIRMVQGGPRYPILWNFAPSKSPVRVGLPAGEYWVYAVAELTAKAPTSDSRRSRPLAAPERARWQVLSGHMRQRELQPNPVSVEIARGEDAVVELALPDSFLKVFSEPPQSFDADGEGLVLTENRLVGIEPAVPRE